MKIRSRASQSLILKGALLRSRFPEARILSAAILIFTLISNALPVTAEPMPRAGGVNLDRAQFQTATTLNFVSITDAHVEELHPTANNGNSDYLQVESANNRNAESYIRFTVSGVSGTVQSARLRVYTITNSSTNGPAVYSTNNTWTETNITWNNRPARTSGVIDNKGTIDKNTWVEYTVTPQVAGNGTYSFVLVGDSSDEIRFSSRQGDNPPQLVVIFNPSPPTATRTATSTLTRTAMVTQLPASTLTPTRTPTPGVVSTTPIAIRTNTPTRTNTPGSTPTSSSLTFTPVDDASIVSGSPATNYGAATTLLVDTSPLQHFLLKFNVIGVNGQRVTSAKLRLYNVDPSSKGGDFYRVVDNSWQEETVTWNNASAADTTLLASLGSVNTNIWYEVNLTALITGDGTYSLRISSTSSDGADYSSKEGGNPPQLVLTLGGIPVSTATPSPTFARTPTGTTSALTPTTTKTSTLVPSPTPLSGSVVVVAVGDIHAEGSDSQAVANLNMVNSINPTAILGLGDYQYSSGTCSNFTASGHYDTDWGSQNYRMYPSFGPTHDYAGTTSGSRADLYFSGDCPGQRNPQSAAAALLGGTIGPIQPYSFDIGSWHIVSLPSLCYRYNCDATAITTWLTKDLNTHTDQCTIAYFHEAYWTSTTTGHPPALSTRPWVQVLYDHGVELLLQAHNHVYERFYPQNMSNVRDDANGITAFVVGTGGIGFYSFTNTAPNSAARSDSTYGVLKLTLGTGSFTWQFVPTSGGTFTDTGSAPCH